MATINPRITENGLAAAINSENTGIDVEITHIAFGTGAYDPTGNETQLFNEVKRVTIAAGSRIREKQIRIAAIWIGDTDDYPISEIGLFYGNTLIAVASRLTGGPFMYKTPGANLIFSYDWFLTAFSAENITVVVDPDAQALLVHLADQNAHPQYLTIAEYEERDHKNSVRAATTANITLSGVQTIDGISLAVGDRVLVKNQTQPKNNGIYVVASGAWSRAGDANSSAKVSSGMSVPVEQGTINADSIWQLTTDGAIALDTTSLAFSVVNGPTGVTAGTYHRVTVDKFGRVTYGSNPETLDGYGITDAQPLSSNLTMFSVVTPDMLAPPGAVMAFAGTSAPFGWLKCNGAAVSRTTYADLFARIGTIYGAGNGSTTFNLPDLRGEFVRGWDDSRGIDVDRQLGSFQADEFEAHTHTWSVNGDRAPTSDGNLVYGDEPYYEDDLVFNTGSSGGSETRPRNIALLYCIKH